MCKSVVGSGASLGQGRAGQGGGLRYKDGVFGISGGGIECEAVFVQRLAALPYYFKPVE